MTISSRTPEGESHRCPICGEVAAVEPSFPGGDSCCPACGALLWKFRDSLRQSSDLLPEEISAATTWEDLGFDSLEVVEKVMELEERFDLSIPDDEAERIQTVGDFIRYLRRRGENL